MFERIGVGAVLSVNGTTPAMKKMFNTIRGINGVHNIDPSDAHITLVDSAETTIDVYSERDRKALSDFMTTTQDYLKDKRVEQTVFTPRYPKLKNYGRRFAIAIEEEEYLRSLRLDVARLAIDALGVSISSRDYDPHCSVAYRVGNKKQRFPERQKLPSNIYVDGFSADWRHEKRYDSQRARNTQVFSHRPQNLRHRSS